MAKGLFDMNLMQEGASMEDSIMDEPITENAGSGSGTKKNYDETPLNIPASKKITPEVYNKAIDALVTTFKESMDIVESLRGMDIGGTDAIAAQQQFTEAALDTAFYESYIDGPFFESVDKSDKVAVRTIVKKLTDNIEDLLYAREDLKFSKVLSVARIVTALITGVGGSGIIPIVWQNRLWQILGVLNTEEDNAKKVAATLTDTFSDTLGDYKIMAVKNPGGISDAFINKFGWKNSRQTFILIVDKKIDEEMKDYEKTELKKSSEKKDEK